MITKLLPCPFCGSDATVHHDTSSDHERQWTWGVGCNDWDDCNASITGAASREAAVAMWNRRKGATVVGSRSACKHCGAPGKLSKSVTDPHQCWYVACSDCGISTATYTQQDEALAAWERTAMYSHRNGETEAPTVPGSYWFRGHLYHRWRGNRKGEWIERSILLIIHSDGEIHPHGGDWTCGDVRKSDGQWWGPVLPPWESAE